MPGNGAALPTRMKSRYGHWHTLSLDTNCTIAGFSKRNTCLRFPALSENGHRKKRQQQRERHEDRPHPGPALGAGGPEFKSRCPEMERKSRLSQSICNRFFIDDGFAGPEHLKLGFL